MKHFRKIMAFVTALALLISILPAGALATTGSTAAGDYILVKTWEELCNGVKEGGKFKLDNDIAAAEIVFIGETDVTMVEPVQVVGTDSSQVSLSDSDFEIGIVPDIVPWLEIPDGVSVTIDLNGHTLSCLGIGVGELKPTTLCVESSNTGGKLTISGGLTVYGNVSFENCAVSTMIFDGGIGEMVLKNASLKMEAASSMPIEEMEGGLWWEGSGIALFGNSTIDINGMFLSFGETTKVSIEAGSKITNIPSVYAWGNDVSADLEKFSSTIEDYASAAGFTLAVDEKEECIFFLKDEKKADSGSLLGVSELNANNLNVTLDDGTYSGGVKIPKVMVDGKELKPDDYDVTYTDAEGNEVSEIKDAGTYTVTIVGKGQYNGTVTKTITIDQATPKYDAPQEPIDGSGSQKETDEQLGSPKGVDNQELSGAWEWSDHAENLGAGKKKYPVTFNPDDANYTSITSDVVVSTWGAEMNVGTADKPLYNYVAKNGTTSAEVSESNIIWLKEESDGLSAWYGLDNSKGTFAEGSRVWVQWLGEKDDSAEWKEYYGKLDDEHKKLIDNGKIWIFLLGVTDPDGNEYKGAFTSDVGLYVQLANGWDKDSINAVFIGEGTDEKLALSFENVATPNLKKLDFNRISLKHFSPYAIMSISLPDPSPETGDTSRILLWILLAAFSCGAMTFAAVYSKKRRQA